MLNSEALSRAIRPFQPQGNNGPRHVHTLPLQVLPRWDAANTVHQAVLVATRQLMADLAVLASTDAGVARLLFVPEGQVHVRRRRLRTFIEQLPSFAAYEAACAIVV